MTAPAPAPIALRPGITPVTTGDIMVLLDERAGTYWQINATGALVLRHLLDGATPEQAAVALARERPGASHAEADVADLLATLREKNLLAG
ncbi:lasso peptide biosynthesis PqqD family chaperone [Streptomyces xiamenensis]|uniref:lasso peptide biosynthesis PqqD family chaperone n=1 Tax=Streptomyces xiamenensis TaxID=408015 RepID=UPI0036E4564F